MAYYRESYESSKEIRQRGIIMITKPIISSDFTIEDIKDMTAQEKINFYNEGRRAFFAEIEKDVTKQASLLWRQQNAGRLRTIILESRGTVTQRFAGHSELAATYNYYNFERKSKEEQAEAIERALTL